ncbi:MAG: hypothetical protein WBI14_05425 [Anaerolineaceae bacterium]
MKLSNKISIFVLITYLGMVIVNGLANTLPINGMITGDISDSYPNLFAPTGITFIIWGVIYLLLAGHTAYQLGLFQKDKQSVKNELLDKVGTLFAISSIANIGWIFSWHYKIIPLSMIFMLVILVCLMLINIRINKEKLTTNEKLFIRLPFSVYFGWITVATIANATVLLVSVVGSNLNLLGISEVAWTVATLLVGLLIGAFTTYRNRDIPYGLVIVWAYIGILIKHLLAEPDGFNSQYPAVIFTVVASLVVLIITLVYTHMKARAERL